MRLSPLLLLLACEDPAKGDGDARLGDTGGAGTTETGDAADTAADTGDTAPTCSRTTALTPLALDGALISPYDVRIAPDLDGKGLADVVVPYGSPTRGFAVYLGEALADGELERLLVGSLYSEQAAHTVGVAGDLDADGLPELALGEARNAEADPNGAQDVVVRWWSPMREVEIGRLLARDASLAEASWTVPPRALPDLDGDGVPEVAVGASTGIRVFSGLAIAGTIAKEDAALLLHGGSLSNGESTIRALPDADGDGLRDVLALGTGGGLHVLTAAAFGAGGTVTIPDLPLLARGGDAEAWGDGLDALLVDVDGDGLDELFATWDEHLVVWRGADVDAALRGERESLGLADALVRADGDDTNQGEYLGVHLAAYTDGDCLPGVAVSAHFNRRVYLLDNATLLAGGTVDLAGVRTYETGGWTGYAMGGGEDVDGDGSMDLAVGTITDEASTVTLLLGP